MSPAPDGPGTASTVGDGPPGWKVRLTVRLTERIAPMVTSAMAPLLEILGVLPDAGLRVAAQFSAIAPPGPAPLSPALHRAVRDMIVVEALGRLHASAGPPARSELFAEIIEFLIELSGTRVEAHDLTHGVIITDVLHDTPRLEFSYPGDLRTVKRAPLLFDGQRSLLVVDRQGRARTELQSHRLDRLIPDAGGVDAYSPEFSHSGSLVAEATRRLGGIGFFLRADRTIWVFADGAPDPDAAGRALDARSRWRWRRPSPTPSAATPPLPISSSRPRSSSPPSGTAPSLPSSMTPRPSTGPSPPRTATTCATPSTPWPCRPRPDCTTSSMPNPSTPRPWPGSPPSTGRPSSTATATFSPTAPSSTSSDSQHEGARTAAATTLSQSAEIVLKVSADGDITVLRAGEVVATLLG